MSRTDHVRAAVAAAALLTLVPAAGCAAGGATPVATASSHEVESPFAACPAPDKRSVARADPSAVDGIALPCFTDGTAVELARLGRPAVLNLWASWCRPCRTELPAMQRLSDAAGDNLVVLGVITRDTRTAAAALAEDLGITFPAVVDESARLQAATGRSALPLTIFVDAAGQVRYVHQTGALTLPELTSLVRTHLGVGVA